MSLFYLSVRKYALPTAALPSIVETNNPGKDCILNTMGKLRATQMEQPKSDLVMKLSGNASSEASFFKKLSMLSKKGYIKYNPDSKTIALTEKGIHYVGEVEGMNPLLAALPSSTTKPALNLLDFAGQQKPAASIPSSLRNFNLAETPLEAMVTKRGRGLGTKKPRVKPEKVQEVKGKIIAKMSENHNLGITEIPTDTLASSVGYTNPRSDAFLEAFRLLLKEGLMVKTNNKFCELTDKAVDEHVPEVAPDYPFGKPGTQKQGQQKPVATIGVKARQAEKPAPTLSPARPTITLFSAGPSSSSPKTLEAPRGVKKY